MCYRFALNNFGQLTEKDKSILSEYPLHQIGTLTAELDNYQRTDALEQASPRFIRHQAACKRRHPAHDEMESENQEDSGELLNPVKRAKFDEICEEMDAVTNEDLQHTMGDSKVRRFWLLRKKNTAIDLVSRLWISVVLCIYQFLVSQSSSS